MEGMPPSYYSHLFCDPVTGRPKIDFLEFPPASNHELMEEPDLSYLPCSAGVGEMLVTGALML